MKKSTDTRGFGDKDYGIPPGVAPQTKKKKSFVSGVGSRVAGYYGRRRAEKAEEKELRRAYRKKYSREALIGRIRSEEMSRARRPSASQAARNYIRELGKNPQRSGRVRRSEYTLGLNTSIIGGGNVFEGGYNLSGKPTKKRR